MAKSRETFNKKEVESKKLKKKKDKEERKEARKGHKSTSFEDMLAYVDEDGNITSTPPDPSKKKKEIDLDEIQIGVPKQENIEPTATIRKGTVTFFNESKGYGFIKDQDTQEDVFVHVKSIKDPIRDRDKVTFEVENTPRGLSAVDVRLIK